MAQTPPPGMTPLKLGQTTRAQVLVSHSPLRIQLVGFPTGPVPPEILAELREVLARGQALVRAVQGWRKEELAAESSPRQVAQVEYERIYEERLVELDCMPGGAQGAHPDMSDLVVMEDPDV